MYQHVKPIKMSKFKLPNPIFTVECTLQTLIDKGFAVIHDQTRTYILHKGIEVDSIDNIDIHYLNLESHTTYKLFNARWFAYRRKKVTALGYKNEINFITFRTALKVMFRRTINNKSKQLI